MKSYAKLFLVLVAAMSVAAVMSSQTLALGSGPVMDEAAGLVSGVDN